MLYIKKKKKVLICWTDKKNTNVCFRFTTRGLLRVLILTVDGAAVLFFTCCFLHIFPILHLECACVCSVATNGVECSELILMGRTKCIISPGPVWWSEGECWWLGWTKIAQRHIVYAQREPSFCSVHARRHNHCVNKCTSCNSVLGKPLLNDKPGDTGQQLPWHGLWKARMLAVGFDFSPLQALPVQNKIDLNPTSLHESFPTVSLGALPAVHVVPQLSHLFRETFPHSVVANI